jgi:hypothetical protein
MKLSAVVLAVLAISSASAMACPGKSNVQASGADRQQSTASIEGTKATDATSVVK